MTAVKEIVVANHSLKSAKQKMAARGWRRNLIDVGDQALMRGLDTAFPIMRPGLFRSYCGRRSLPATKRLTDIPLPWFCPRRRAEGVLEEAANLRLAAPPDQLPT
jgi:hypothetical protein